MTLIRFAVLFSLVALCSFSVPAQLRRIQPRPPVTMTAQERQVLETKARALLEEVIAEGAVLKLVENRIFVELSAADALWKSDEPRARTLAQHALSQFNALTFDFEPNDPRYWQMLNQRRTLRQLLLRTLAPRDAKLALEFLRTSRANQPAGPDERDAANMERQLEMQLAMQIAASDPQLALQVAEESLKQGLSYQVVELWQRLLQKDAQAATKLLDDMLDQFKSGPLLSQFKPGASLSSAQPSPDAVGVAFNLLGYLNARLTTPENAHKRLQAQAAANYSPEDLKQRYRELLELLVSATLTLMPEHFYNDALRYPAQNMLMQMKTLLPQVEKYLPQRAAALRAKLAQFSKVLSPENNGQALQQLAEKSSAEEILALAAKAPAEQRNQYYEQAMWKALGAQDSTKARRIIEENIQNPQLRSQWLGNIEREEINRLAGQEKYEEARRLLARLPSDTERVNYLTQWANGFAQKGDQKTARQFLAEAQALVGDRMETRMQMEQQINLATASVKLDPARSFEIAAAAIERCNALIAAAAVLDTYEQSNGFQEGEFFLLQGNAFQRFSYNLINLMPELARQDFDHTSALVRRWQNSETRLLVELALIQPLLTNQPEAGRVVVGEEFREGIGIRF